MDASKTCEYKGQKYLIQIGPKGGKYFIDNLNKKHYVSAQKYSKIPKEKSNSQLHNSKSNKSNKPIIWQSNRNNQYIHKTSKYCCCCGKELSREDIHYYDLEDYCIDCAIADGIRTSKD